MKFRNAIIALASFGAAVQACDGAEKGWPLAGYDLSGSGFNWQEQKLGADNVARLDVDWVFDTAAAGMAVRPIHATPVVDEDGRSYVGDFGGRFFAVTNKGGLKWSFAADPPTTEVGLLLSPELGAPEGAPFLGAAAIASSRPYVVVADANGRVYARHRDTGAEIWTVRNLNTNPLGGVAGNALTISGDTVFVGMSSLENYALVLSAAGLRVDCCSHQGALIALELATGEVKWRYETAPAAQPLPASAAPFVLGPSGAGIWSQPTIDLDSGTIYVSTGQNLSPTSDGGSTPTSDAIIAIDIATGQQKWVHQFTVDDVWAVGVPNPHPVTGQYLDMDLGDAPKIYKLDGGRVVVGAGQKDGRYHVLDAATGELIRSRQVISPRNDLGGFQTGGAWAYGLAFQHGLAATDGFTSCNEGDCPYEGFDGTVVALSGDGAETVWAFNLPGSPMIGGLSVANGLVFFQAPVDEKPAGKSSPEWGLYALDAWSGHVEHHVKFPGRAIGSPVVADGRVYVTTGNGALPAYGIVPQGELIRMKITSAEKKPTQSVRVE